MICQNDNSQLRMAKKNEWVKPRLAGKFALEMVGLHWMLLNKGRILPNFILEGTLWKNCLWFLLLLHEDHIASMLASITAL